MERQISLDRRRFVRGVGTAGLTVMYANAALASDAGDQADNRAVDKATDQPAPGRTPDEILQSLIEGNQRFASGNSRLAPRTAADFARDAMGQAPRTVILGCADSRVPPEFIFDQPNGSLFVLRARQRRRVLCQCHTKAIDQSHAIKESNRKKSHRRWRRLCRFSSLLTAAQ